LSESGRGGRGPVTGYGDERQVESVRRAFVRRAGAYRTRSLPYAVGRGACRRMAM